MNSFLIVFGAPDKIDQAKKSCENTPACWRNSRVVKNYCVGRSKPEVKGTFEIHLRPLNATKEIPLRETLLALLAASTHLLPQSVEGCDLRILTLGTHVTYGTGTLLAVSEISPSPQLA